MYAFIRSDLMGEFALAVVCRTFSVTQVDYTRGESVPPQPRPSGATYSPI